MASGCVHCTSAMNEGAVVCLHCGQPLSAQYAMESSRSEPSHDLSGIGGWLILVAIGLAIAPFMRAHGIVTDSKFLFGIEYRTAINSKSELQAMLFYELVTNSFFFALLLLLNVLFYKKQKRFPIFNISSQVLALIAQLIDHFWGARLGYSSDPSQLFGIFAAAALWIPYMMYSKRVGQTFVN